MQMSIASRRIIQVIVVVISAVALLGSGAALHEALSNDKDLPETFVTTTDVKPARGVVWSLGAIRLGSGLYLMQRVGGPYDPTNSAFSQEEKVIVPSQSSVIWRADEESQGVFFPSAMWAGTLDVGEAWKYKIEIGTASVDGKDFESYGDNGETNFSAVSYWNVEADIVNVLKGQYLAVRITNLGENDMPIVTNEHSNVTWPVLHKPRYPYPEASGVILLVAGLICLGGYMGWAHAHNRIAKKRLT